MLTALSDTVTWARIKFKAIKSRCLIIRDGKTTKRFKLHVQEEEISSIVDKPIKCLGKWFDASLGDTNNVQQIRQQLLDGLKTIDKTNLPG